MWGKKMKIEGKGNQEWRWRRPHQRCIVTRHSYRSTYTCVCVCVCAMDSTLEFIPEFVMGWISNLSIVSEMMASYLPLVRNFGLLTRGLPSWSSKGVNIRELDAKINKCVSEGGRVQKKRMKSFTFDLFTLMDEFRSYLFIDFIDIPWTEGEVGESTGQRNLFVAPL